MPNCSTSGGLILEKIENPINDDNKKVLLFTAFADTANYLYDNLAALLKTKGLHTGKVTGKDAPKSTLKKGYDFQSLLTLFSPIAKEKALILPNEPAEIDLLIGTDCISEGQNLQDCDYVVNCDIHWNPVPDHSALRANRPHRLPEQGYSTGQLLAGHQS